MIVFEGYIPRRTHRYELCGGVEIGYRMNENYWGQGIATKAAAMIVDFLFSEVYTCERYCKPLDNDADDIILDWFMPCIKETD
jgi:RimJ/RimL family protein N-acetyltransferase